MYAVLRSGRALDICTHMCVCVHVGICVCVYVCMRICVHVYVFMCVSLCVRMCVCVHVGAIHLGAMENHFGFIWVPSRVI